MNDLGSLDIAWTQGYSGQSLAYIDDGVLCYMCGKHVQFVTETETLPAFLFPGKGVGPLAVHKLLKKFAVAERCQQPNIHIYNYPSFEEIAVLEDGAYIQFETLEFSYSNYFASLSGVPDFILIIWDFEKQERLTSLVMLNNEPRASLAFNPLNWHQLIVTSSKHFQLLLIEHNCDSYLLKKHNIILPRDEPDDDTRNDQENESTRGHVRFKSSNQAVTDFKVVASNKAISGLNKHRYQRQVELDSLKSCMAPLSSTWAPNGNVFLSTEKGHLIKVNVESLTPQIVHFPKPEKTISHEELLTPGWKPQNYSGKLECLALHQLGLFAIGGEGDVVQFDVTKLEVEILRVIPMHCPLSTLTFNYSYTELVLGSPRGAIIMGGVEDLDDFRQLLDIFHGEFVGLGMLGCSSDVCVTARSTGMVQTWSISDGTLLSSTDIVDKASCLACSPLVPVVAVGTQQGYVYFLDGNASDLRIIHRTYLYKGPCKNLVFDDDGLYLFTLGSDQNVFVLNGRPSSVFAVMGYVEIRGYVQKISVLNDDSTVKVAVTVAKGEKKTYSQEIILFEVSADFFKALQENLKNNKGEFDDESIQKKSVSLSIPVHDVALYPGGQLFFVSALNGSIHCVYIGQEEKTREIMEGNQLPEGKLTLSPYKRFLASYGRDGKLAIHSSDSLIQRVHRQLYDHSGKGVLHVAFSPNCRSVITVGYDGLITGCVWNWASREVSSELDLLCSKRNEQLAVIRGNEFNNLIEINGWDPPQSQSDAEQKRVRFPSEDSEMDSPPKPDPSCTWLQNKEFEVFVAEKQEYAQVKRHIKDALAFIQKQLQAMVHTNEQLPDLQKLDKHEFELDIDEQVKQQHEEETALEKARTDILCQDEIKKSLTELIKRECWDNMLVKGRAIKAFNSDRTVYNYPMIPRSATKLQNLERVLDRRRLEQKEREIRIRETEDPGNSSDNIQCSEMTDLHRSPIYAASNLQVMGVTNELMYTQVQLNLRHQKLKQIAIIEDCIYKSRQMFNEQFDALFNRKEMEIIIIKEKNKRVAQILKSLERSDPLIEPTFTVLEDPQQLFVVNDDEVTVELVLSEKEKKQREEEQRVRDLLDQQDTTKSDRVRALNDMMGGVLEISREELLKQDIPVPWFVDEKEKEDWTEEEQRIYTEFKAKVKELAKERETFRKQLETELEKLLGMIGSSMKGFDEALEVLETKRMGIEVGVCQEELQVVRLRLSLLREEEMLAWVKQLKDRISKLLDEKEDNEEIVKDCEKLVEGARSDYEVMVAEDRIMEKGFRREFNDLPGTAVDNLLRHFKKRPKVVKSKSTVDGKKMNPFAEGLAKLNDDDQQQVAFEAALDEMDQIPDNFNPIWWERFVDYRRAKIDSEQKIKQKLRMISEMQAFLQMRKAEEEALSKEIEATLEEYSEARQSHETFSNDVELQLLLRQDQVEVDPVAFVRSYEDCLLVDKNRVIELNSTVKHLGEQKIEIMNVSKEFGKEIIQLQWEHKRLQMELEDLTRKMRDITMTKVTREVQEYLKESDYDAKKAEYVAKMERNIAFEHQHHANMMQMGKKKQEKLQKVMKKREDEQRKKDGFLEEANVSLNEMFNIERVHTQASTADEARQQRHQRLQLRKQLLTTAQHQAQEIAALQSELLRLRLRTYPSFQVN